MFTSVKLFLSKLKDKQIIDCTDDRIYTGKLIAQVISGRLDIKRALVNFPKDVPDLSIQAAWHALFHLEADEDIRANDAEYKEEQDIYLKQIAETLSEGKELPQNVIQAYKEFYPYSSIPHKGGLVGFLANFERFINT